MDYTPSEQIKRIQKTLESFEQKKALVERLRGDLLSKEVQFERSLKAISSEEERKKQEAVKAFEVKSQEITDAFEALMVQIENDAHMGRVSMEEELDVLRGKLNHERAALLQVAKQIEAELGKVGVKDIVSPVKPIEVSPDAVNVNA